MAIRIQRMSKEDIREVIRLGESAEEFDTGTDTPNFYGQATMERWVQSEYGVNLVACQDNILVAGFLLGQALPASRDAYIHATYVRPEFRGLHIATTLTKAAEERFLELGCNHVFSNIDPSNFAILAVKKRLGYKIGKPHFYVDKMLG